MKQILLTGFLFFLVVLISAQVPGWQWASKAGGLGYDHAQGVAADAAGNTNISGFFAGSCTFGSLTVSSHGYSDIFVTKYDTYGDVVWAVAAGGSNQDEAKGMICDAAGNIYITGFITGSASFGDKVFNTAGGKDIFVAKLNSSGTWLWVVTGGGLASESAQSLALDDAGNIYVAGLICGPGTFGAYTTSSFGEEDVLVAKLDPSGNWLWAATAGGVYDDQCQAIAFDPRGFLMLAGQVKGNAIFGGGQSHGNNYTNGFVAAMNPIGGWLWVNRIVSTNWVEIKDLTLDPHGYIYVSGGFGNSWTYGSISLTANSMGDCFLAKFDNQSSDCLWVKQAGNSSDDWGGPVAVKSTGQVYWAGYFVNQLQLGDFTIPFVSSADIFLARLSPDGIYEWAGHAGGICEDYPFAMVLDSQERVCLAGGYSGEMYFDDIHLSWCNDGSDDIFVARRYDLPVGVNDPDSPELAGISNYPNPFTASTTIVYELKAPVTEVSLEVYNLKGQRLRQMQDIPSGSGIHQVNWDRKDERGAKVAPGVYYYRLRNGAESRIGKMLILN